MARKFLSSPVAPTQMPVAGPGGRLTLDWERYFDRLEDWVTKQPSCHVYHDADQTLSTATWTILSFNTEEHDNAAMHDESTNNDRITIPRDGIFVAGFQVVFDTNTTGLRWAYLTVNAAAATPTVGEILAADNQTPVTGFGTFLSGCATKDLTAGDILRVHAYQNSGGDLDVLSTGTQSPRFWCYEVSK